MKCIHWKRVNFHGWVELRIDQERCRGITAEKHSDIKNAVASDHEYVMWSDDAFAGDRASILFSYIWDISRM